MLSGVVERFTALSALTFSLIGMAWLLSALMPPQSLGTGKLDLPRRTRRTRKTPRSDLMAERFRS